MKKIILSIALFFLIYSKSNACSWYDPDYEYFNLFTQSIIKDKNYLPFLHTLSNRFYGHEHFEIPNENIENWQKFFGNSLSYTETKMLVEAIPMSELNAFKKGNYNNLILKKLGSYQKYSEAIDYLIEAKYLEPFMRISYIEGPNSFYYENDESLKNATQLDYAKTISALASLYNTAKNPEIKLRYGYQLVRFNHYVHQYQKSVEAFRTYVEPLKIKSAPYYLALDQLAGAQRGLKLFEEANWNFMQIFMNSKSRKENVFTSMMLSDSVKFDHLLARAKSPQEKNMAYFLLAYDDYSNPIPMMEKMYDIDPNSEILKVLAARSVNELERNYLPTYFDDRNINLPIAKEKNEVGKTEIPVAKETSFWQKIKSFFTNIFSSDETKMPKNGNEQSDQQLLNNPNRIPFFVQPYTYGTEEAAPNFLDNFENLTSKIKDKSEDEFWQITAAYLSFLKKDYEESIEILNKIKTTNPEYVKQIDRMKMLNDIVSQPRITADFEEHLVRSYPKLYDISEVKDSVKAIQYGEIQPSTEEFIQDILANRYFLQGEDGKSFLMSNKLSDLQYNPNSNLVKSVEEFYKKPNKSALEKKIIARNVNDVGNIEAFFNLIYGDREMRLANFEKAKEYFSKTNGFKGISRVEYSWGESDTPTKTKKEYGDSYNGFAHISSFIFGHNYWESFTTPENQTMRAENYAGFNFIKEDMNKLELSEAVIQLKKIASGTGEKAADANQLIGNLLYNSSILGYFREVFVMDVDNNNGPKFHFYNSDQPVFKYYYKNFGTNSYIEPDNFGLAIGYYEKALNKTQNKEKKARILFQMASAEQGKYYQYEAKNSAEINYDDPDWSKKQDDFSKKMNQLKNEKYRTYFAEMKKNYGDTQTSKGLQGTCSYYDYFMKSP